MENEDLAEKLKVMGEPTRLRILNLLPDQKDCEEVYNVTELAEELGIPQPSVSHHLKVLKQAGLLKSEKMCRDVYYWIDRKAFDHALKSVDKILK